MDIKRFTRILIAKSFIKVITPRTIVLLAVTAILAGCTTSPANLKDAAEAGGEDSIKASVDATLEAMREDATATPVADQGSRGVAPTPKTDGTPIAEDDSTETLTSVTGRAMWNDQPLKAVDVIAVMGDANSQQPPVATGSVDADGYITITLSRSGLHTIWVTGTDTDEYWGTGAKVWADPGNTIELGYVYINKKLTLHHKLDRWMTSTPTFTWDAFPDAVNYHIDVFDTTTDEAVIQIELGNATEYTVETPLTPKINYIVNVRAESASGTGIAYDRHSFDISDETESETSVTPSPTVLATNTDIEKVHAVFYAEHYFSDSYASHIYIIEPNAENPKNISNDRFWDINPTLSPDGTKIAFMTAQEGDYEIRVMNADGSNQIAPLSRYPLDIFSNLPNAEICKNESVYFQNIIWSPDGNSMAFSATHYCDSTNHTNAIYTMDPDGSNVYRLINLNASPFNIGWSPDGSKIIFEAWEAEYSDIFTVDIDGYSSDILTNSDSWPQYPKWSPDGSKIVFSLYKENTSDPAATGNNSIYFMDADGSNRYELPNLEGDAYTPSWSPDGSKIVFEGYEGDYSDIFTADIDGSNIYNLTNSDSQDSTPKWSPDGRKIIFTSYFNGAPSIYVMDSDGSNQKLWIEFETNAEISVYMPHLLSCGVTECYSFDSSYTIEIEDPSEGSATQDAPSAELTTDIPDVSSSQGDLPDIPDATSIQDDADCDETKPTQFVASGFTFQSEDETFLKVDDDGNPQGNTCGILGSYQRFPVLNDWHTGIISYDTKVTATGETGNSQYRWTNNAGSSWPLYPEFHVSRFNTDSQNPYYDYPPGESHPYFTIFAGHPDISEGDNRKRPIDFFTTIQYGDVPIGTVGETYELEGWAVEYGCCVIDDEVTAKVIWGDSDQAVPVTLNSDGLVLRNIQASHVYESPGEYNGKIMVFSKGILIAEATFDAVVRAAS